MKNFVLNFYFEWEKLQQRYQKPKKNQTVPHIESTHPKERFVIDVVYLSNFISTTHRYLITMVDHFSKYGWAKIAKDKNSQYNSKNSETILYVSWMSRDITVWQWKRIC